MKRVYICTPYRGDVETHLAIAKRIALTAVELGCAPVVPHVTFHDILDDNSPTQRERGLEIAISLLDVCDEIWAYTELGISEGMGLELEHARQRDIQRLEITDLERFVVEPDPIFHY